MKKAFFLLGLILLFFSSFFWITSSDTRLFRLAGSEFLTLLGLSFVMMAPEIIDQARRFFSTHSEDVPF